MRKLSLSDTRRFVLSLTSWKMAEPSSGSSLSGPRAPAHHTQGSRPPGCKTDKADSIILNQLTLYPNTHTQTLSQNYLHMSRIQQVRIGVGLKQMSEEKPRDSGRDKKPYIFSLLAPPADKSCKPSPLLILSDSSYLQS
jgi:hypothetical protein